MRYGWWSWLLLLASIALVALVARWVFERPLGRGIVVALVMLAVVGIVWWRTHRDGHQGERDRGP